MATTALHSSVPCQRVRVLTSTEVAAAGEFVLYWMIANRRVGWNFSLQRALDWSEHLGKPLVIFEPLQVDYPWASARFHRFVAEGMRDNQQALAQQPVLYYPYLEPEPGAGRGAFAALAARSAVVVTDDFPCFFHPALLRIAARQTPVRFEAIDSNGLWPQRGTDQVFARAYDFRRFLQKNLLEHLLDLPQANPFAGRRVPRPRLDLASLQQRWRLPPLETSVQLEKYLAQLPIEQAIQPIAAAGGTTAAREQLQRFVHCKLADYGEERNVPDVAAASELSGWLHFGHLSTHEIFAEVAAAEGWTPARLAAKANGSSNGWWGMRSAAESFLDELITWRELGFNCCALRRDYDQYESLPAWAQATLAKHARDPRPNCYELDEFEQSRTHDPLWNAAQRQLVREGRIHNYLRMLWGKKILEWAESPQTALQVMIELNNKYAIDGRNPNSYSGIFWVLGRYDRPWGPERPIFGTIRYMSSENTARKVSVKEYLRRYSTEPTLFAK